MNLSTAFPSRYLTASDLPDEGSMRVTIEKISLEEVGRDKETKPCIYFEEFNKALICNKTNGRTIARALGSEEFDEWIGRSIALYRADVEFAGEMVQGIRVKAIRTPATVRQIPAKKKPVHTPEPEPMPTEEPDDDEIPF